MEQGKTEAGTKAGAESEPAAESLPVAGAPGAHAVQDAYVARRVVQHGEATAASYRQHLEGQLAGAPVASNFGFYVLLGLVTATLLLVMIAVVTRREPDAITRIEAPFVSRVAPERRATVVPPQAGASSPRTDPGPQHPTPNTQHPPQVGSSAPRAAAPAPSPLFSPAPPVAPPGAVTDPTSLPNANPPASPAPGTPAPRPGPPPPSAAVRMAPSPAPGPGGSALTLPPVTPQAVPYPDRSRSAQPVPPPRALEAP